MTLKSVWRVIRVLLFVVGFIAGAALVLPCAVMMGQGDFTLMYAYITVFALGFCIQTLEHKAGWVDDWYNWKK